MAMHRDTSIDPTAKTASCHIRLGGYVSDHLGRQLRSLYDDLVTEPVPPALERKLRELDERKDKV